MVLKPSSNVSASAKVPIDDIKQLDTIQCGVEARQHFTFADGYRNLNHGIPTLHTQYE